MEKKLIALIIVISLSLGGVISPESIRFIIDSLPISSASATAETEFQSLPSVSQMSVGALRPPSEYFKSDRSCLCCHIHGNYRQSSVRFAQLVRA